jgi:hypothetical protein
MVKVIIGNKGSGKTGQLVDGMNQQVLSEGKDVVCIERGHRLVHQVRHEVRLVDMDDYPVRGYQGLLGLISGVCARDYDVTDVYIDSIFKVIMDDDIESLAAFLPELDSFSTKNHVDFTIILSADPDTVPASILQYQS